jgi:hypothetical protein
VRPLSERRARDRAEIARQIVTVAADFGATAEICPVMSSGRRVWLRIAAPGGLQATVTLDSDSPQPDVHVIPWHTLGSDARLSDDFSAHVNPHHRRKATEVAEGTAGLLAHIADKLRMVRDGLAYVTESNESTEEESCPES